MKRRVIAWSASVFLGTAGFAFASGAIVDRGPQLSPIRVGTTQTEVISHASDTGAWQAAPFRTDRRLAPRPYSPEDTDPLDEAALGRPDWVLTGVVAGVSPMALFEGVPGAGGTTRVVTLGDSVGGFVLKEVRAASAVLAAVDIEWTYTLEIPWRY